MQRIKRQPGDHLGTRREWLPVTVPQYREVGGAQRPSPMDTEMRANGVANDGKVRQENEEAID